MSLSSLVDALCRPAWRWLWRILAGLLVTAWVFGLAAWLTLHWLILPRLDEWRPSVEAQASRLLGHPVQIGRIAVHSSGWVPAFTLHDVLLRDAQGREALRLPQVSAALAVPALLAGQLRFEQLLIDDARLEVRRDAMGRWHVAGLDMGTGGPALDGSAAADWFFEQHEFVIRRGSLRWVDEQRAAPPLQLSDVQLVLRNRGRRHALRLDATPPPDWGQRFGVVAQARGPLLARAGDWQRWQGTLHVDLPQVDVSRLRHHVDLPVDLRQGRAALRAWVDWDQGVPLALTLDAALRDVSVRLALDLAPLAFAELGGRLVAERSADGVKLALQNLAFASAEGQRWAPSQMRLQWQQTQALKAGDLQASQPVTGGELSADRLDLDALAELGERLPIGSGLRSLLHQLNPEGTVQQLQARWEGPLDAPRRYSAQARVKGLAIAAAPSPEPGGIGRPGWHGADLQIDASESGGRAELVLADGAMEFPGVFEQATVPLAHFSAQLQWRMAAAALRPGAAAARGSEAPPRIELKVLNARFDNDDARGALSASWHTGAGSGFGKGGRLPGVLELSGNLEQGQAARVARYLPWGIGPDTRAWVQRAVQGGRVKDVNFRVKGDLWDFPYVNRRDGDFRIAAQLVDVTLAPVPSAPAGKGVAAWESPWPALSGIHGELVFERNAMQFQQARGRLWGTELNEVQGRIRELGDAALLEINGQARGPAADLLRLLRSTPLGEPLAGALDAASASGAIDITLATQIPLNRPQDGMLKASLQLPGNDLRLRPDWPLLPAARGRLEATQKGVQVIGLRSQLAGGELQIDGGSQADGSQRYTLAGHASADGLRRLAEPGSAAARWAQRLQGQAAYRLLIEAQAQRFDWQLSSPLQGLAIDLPPPLRKAAEATLPLRIASTEPRGSAADSRPAAPRDALRLDMGPLQANLVLDRRGEQPRLLRSALAYDSPLPEPVAGGRAVLALPRLDVQPWRDLLAASATPAATSAAISGAGASAPAGSAGGTPPASGAASPSTGAAWLPASVQLKTAELQAGGRRLTGLTLDLQRLSAPGEEGWRAQLQSDQATGSVDWREPRSAGGAGRIKARLARLSLPQGEAETVASALDIAPASAVPALDIEVEDFELRGRKLGRLAVEAINRVPGSMGQSGDEPNPRSEWQLNRLQLIHPQARLTATGRWQPVAGSARRHMAMDFTLQVDDGGLLLERLGFGRVVRGAKGQLKGTLGWDGSPLELDYPSLGGALALSFEGGQFLKVDPGAARLLGVLSLQALPRRLLLDFRDLFQEGFAFDNISGDLAIQRGLANTRNLRLRGLQALVLMEGSADIARETQDLHIVVVPELSTASASLAYAAINPAVGLGAFLGQWLLREPLRQASAREFHVSGGWDDPHIARVERGLLDPLPDAAGPMPAAAASAPAAPAAAAPPPSTPSR